MPAPTWENLYLLFRYVTINSGLQALPDLFCRDGLQIAAREDVIDYGAVPNPFRGRNYREINQPLLYLRNPLGYNCTIGERTYETS